MLNAEIQLDDQFLGSTINLQMIRDPARHLVSLIAQTNPVVPISYCTVKVQVKECQWTRSWWAKTIRFLCSKRWAKWCIPYPIECLANATEVVHTPKIIMIPERALSKVQAQLAELRMNGKIPKLIVIGFDANHQALDSMHFSMLRAASPNLDSEFDDKLFNVPLVVTHKIDSNSVLVL